MLKHASKQSTLKFDSKRDEFVIDLCELFTALNISMKKIKHTSFKRFIENYLNMEMLSETSLRCTYFPKIYSEVSEILNFVYLLKIYINIRIYNIICTIVLIYIYKRCKWIIC